METFVVAFFFFNAYSPFLWLLSFFYNFLLNLFSVLFFLLVVYPKSTVLISKLNGNFFHLVGENRSLANQLSS